MKKLATLILGALSSLLVGMVSVPTGKFSPFTRNSKKNTLPASPTAAKSEVTVGGFRIDENLVTLQDYKKFLETHPQWLKSKVKSIFADAHYLNSWKKDLDFSPGNPLQPVTEVSWFAATAYCEARGLQLPTTEQWEYALHDDNRNAAKLTENILAWYGQPNNKPVGKIMTTVKNGFGIWDMGFLVWEWTEDFNSFLSNPDGRDNSGKDMNLFCGSGSLMGDPSDYATFMRYSFRSSLKANYTTNNLGFRCAIKETP